MEQQAAAATTLLNAATHGDMASVTTWANSLRRKPLPDAYRETHAFVHALLASQHTAQALRDVAEAIRPGLHHCSPCRGAAEGEPLASQETAVLYTRLLGQELLLHEQVMQLSDDVDVEGMALAIHRSMAVLVERQQVYYLHYLPIPEKEWLLLHRLYYIAIEHHIAGHHCVDKARYLGKQLVIRDLYAIALLMGCGRLNHLSPKEMGKLFALLPDWGPLVGISREPAGDSDNQLVVDITTGAAPSFRKLFAEGEHRVCCYLQVEPLLAKLDQLIAMEEKQGHSNAFGVESHVLPASVIRQLKSAWSEYIYREARVPTDESVQVCRDFNSVFYYLTGGQTLKEFAGSKMSLSIVYDDNDDVSTIGQQRSTDIWSAFISAPDGKLVTGAIPSEFHFQQHFPEKNPGQVDPDHPVEILHMSDTSSRGCRVEWGKPTRVPAVGDLVALRSNASQGHWQMAQVAWKHQDGDGNISTGLKLLSTQAIPVAFDVPLRLGLKDNYAGGILLPPEDALGTSGTVFVAPPIALQEGEYISISQKGIEEKIQLSKALQATPAFHSFDCAFVVRNTPTSGLR